MPCGDCDVEAGISAGEEEVKLVFCLSDMSVNFTLAKSISAAAVSSSNRPLAMTHFQFRKSAISSTSKQTVGFLRIMVSFFPLKE